MSAISIKIESGDLVKISKSSSPVFWTVVGIRIPFKDIPSHVLLILKHNHVFRHNVNINKVREVIKNKKD